MAFSWKMAKKRNIRKLKVRKQIMLKLGDTMAAKNIERKLERLEHDKA